MSIRAEILAETLARLEAERFAPPRRPNLTTSPAAPPPVTPAQATRNAELLLAALDGDVLLIDYAEKETA